MIIARTTGGVEFGRPLATGWTGTAGLNWQRSHCQDDQGRLIQEVTPPPSPLPLLPCPLLHHPCQNVVPLPKLLAQPFGLRSLHSMCCCPSHSAKGRKNSQSLRSSPALSLPCRSKAMHLWFSSIGSLRNLTTSSSQSMSPILLAPQTPLQSRVTAPS